MPPAAPLAQSLCELPLVGRAQRVKPALTWGGWQVEAGQLASVFNSGDCHKVYIFVLDSESSFLQFLCIGLRFDHQSQTEKKSKKVFN